MTHPQHCYWSVSLAANCAGKREEAGLVHEEGYIVPSSLGLLACGSDTNNIASLSEISLLSGAEAVKKRGLIQVWLCAVPKLLHGSSSFRKQLFCR